MHFFLKPWRVLFLVCSLFLLFTFLIPTASANTATAKGTQSSPKIFTSSFTFKTPSKGNSGKVTPNNITAGGNSCAVVLSAGKIGGPAMEGWTTISCNGIMGEIVVAMYSQHCNLSTFGICYSWTTITSYRECDILRSTSLKCPPVVFVQGVSNGQLWRFESNIEAVALDGGLGGTTLYNQIQF